MAAEKAGLDKASRAVPKGELNKAGEAIQSTAEQAESYMPLKRILEPLKITKRAHAQKGKGTFR